MTPGISAGATPALSVALRAAPHAPARQTIDIVSFIPPGSVDPIYFDKPYVLAPDKRGAKPYSLLMRAMQDTGRCALAKWAWLEVRYPVYIVEVG